MIDLQPSNETLAIVVLVDVAPVINPGNERKDARDHVDVQVIDVDLANLAINGIERDPIVDDLYLNLDVAIVMIPVLEIDRRRKDRGLDLQPCVHLKKKIVPNLYQSQAMQTDINQIIPKLN